MEKKSIRELAIELAVEITFLCENSNVKAVYANQLLRSCKLLIASITTAKTGWLIYKTVILMSEKPILRSASIAYSLRKRRHVEASLEQAKDRHFSIFFQRRKDFSSVARYSLERIVFGGDELRSVEGDDTDLAV